MALHLSKSKQGKENQPNDSGRPLTRPLLSGFHTNTTTMIRPYQSADKQALVEIFELHTPQCFAPAELENFTTYLDENSNTYLTIEYLGKIVGGVGCLFNYRNKVAWVTWMFLHPEARGLGLGKLAIKYCFNLLRGNGHCKKILVTTSQLVYRFYEKCGYRLINIKKNYWGQETDLCTMELNFVNE